jgi:hypothetical protein
MLAHQPRIRTRTRRQPWEFTRAYGVRRSFTWISPEAAERRLQNHTLLIDRLSPEALAVVRSYDGPWTAAPGAALLRDRVK